LKNQRRMPTTHHEADCAAGISDYEQQPHNCIVLDPSVAVVLRLSHASSPTEFASP
jgi:hypothetical protein